MALSSSYASLRPVDGAWEAPAGDCNNPLCALKIRALENELNRLRSAGLDVLKQHGQWQASGQRPDEIGREYDDLFNHEVEEMANMLSMSNTHMDNSQARQLLGTTFQGVYDSCKEAMLKKLTDTLSRVLELPGRSEDDEELYDVCRAYGLLVSAINSKDSGGCGHQAEQVNFKLKEKAPGVDLDALTAQMSKLSWKMLNTVPPLVSETITDTPMQSDWHDPEMKPLWDDSLQPYSLVYYRPILFFSYEGKVAQKGWIGNKPMELNDEDKVSSSSPVLTKDDTGNPYGFPEDCGEIKYKRPPKLVGPSEPNGSNSPDGFELLDLNPNKSRVRDLESTVVLSDPFEEDKSEYLDSESEEDNKPSIKPIGLKIT